MGSACSRSSTQQVRCRAGSFRSEDLDHPSPNVAAGAPNNTNYIVSHPSIGSPAPTEQRCPIPQEDPRNGVRARLAAAAATSDKPRWGAPLQTTSGGSVTPRALPPMTNLALPKPPQQPTASQGVPVVQLTSGSFGTDSASVVSTPLPALQSSDHATYSPAVGSIVTIDGAPWMPHTNSSSGCRAALGNASLGSAPSAVPPFYSSQWPAHRLTAVKCTTSGDSSSSRRAAGNPKIDGGDIGESRGSLISFRVEEVPQSQQSRPVGLQSNSATDLATTSSTTTTGTTGSQRQFRVHSVPSAVLVPILNPSSGGAGGPVGGFNESTAMTLMSGTLGAGLDSWTQNPAVSDAHGILQRDGSNSFGNFSADPLAVEVGIRQVDGNVDEAPIPHVSHTAHQARLALPSFGSV